MAGTTSEPLKLPSVQLDTQSAAEAEKAREDSAKKVSASYKKVMAPADTTPTRAAPATGADTEKSGVEKGTKAPPIPAATAAPTAGAVPGISDKTTSIAAPATIAAATTAAGTLAAARVARTPKPARLPRKWFPGLDIGGGDFKTPGPKDYEFKQIGRVHV